MVDNLIRLLLFPPVMQLELKTLLLGGSLILTIYDLHAIDDEGDWTATIVIVLKLKQPCL